MKAPTESLSQREFILLMALLSAMVAFAIDAMLPALPQIGAELTPDNLNQAQLIITSFVLGMGIGTFFTGPLSDTFGRRTVIIGGSLLYFVAAAAAYVAPTMETVLLSRLIMGLGAAGPRVATMALIRDIYGGREMARIMSLVSIIFVIFPAFAPTLGYYIIGAFGWRSIFAAFCVFSSVCIIWMTLRQPETLKDQDRRSLSIKLLFNATKEVFANQTTFLSIIIQTLTYGMLFTCLSSVQPAFDRIYDQGHTFHYWFGAIALMSGSASLLNAKIVEAKGMRAIVRASFSMLIVSALFMMAVHLMTSKQTITFPVFIVFIFSGFFAAGLTIGNLNALAMEPLPHIAGVAATIISAFSTIGSVIIAIPLGLAFNDTPYPMGLGVLVCSGLALWLTNMIKRPGEA